MNFVTLTVHSPSHASATVEAKVKKRNNRTAENMEVGEVGVKGRKREREEGKEGQPLKFNDRPLNVMNTGFRTTKILPAEITGRGFHSYSPAKLDFRSTIRNDEV